MMRQCLDGEKLDLEWIFSYLKILQSKLKLSQRLNFQILISDYVLLFVKYFVVPSEDINSVSMQVTKTFLV